MTSNPVVSVIVANYNGSPFLSQSLRSLLRQSLSSIEIIVIDDASSDNSVAILEEAARADSRVRWHRLSSNSGPARARNVGLDQARGQWVAIVDSDDLIHPRRLDWLVRTAETHGADIIADDLLVFSDDGATPGRFLRGTRSRKGAFVALEQYIKENAIFARRPALGYLKPVFLRSALEKYGLRYNEALRIGEDFDLVVRSLACGLKLRIEPQPYYLYRKHSRSISNLFSSEHIARSLEADRAFLETQRVRGLDLRAAFSSRESSLLRALSWNDLVAVLKKRQLIRAAGILLRRPSLALLLTWPIRARIGRQLTSLRALAHQRETGKSICLISRQRLTSAVSGSASYVLSLAGALRDAGFDVHLLQPSPSIFGRLPVLKCGPESSVFKSMRIRNGIIFGSFIVAGDPRILGPFLRGVFARLGRKIGFRLEDRPAPYSVAAPWEAKDYEFLARYAPALSDSVVFDYAFQTDAAPYVLRPDAKTFVLMHDLISSRNAQFAQLSGSDSMPEISENEELRMLTGADTIVAIQEEEAALVRRKTGGHKTICVPIAVRPSRRAHTGASDRLLFVGTKTAPNVIGINWFLSEVWPKILSEVPGAKLDIVGSISRVLGDVPKNVEVHGIVPNLSPLYQATGVIVSPLLAGSGLKIKLMEALAYGKAIVATTATMQGVRELVGDAVMVADDATAFAGAVTQLLKDDKLRERMAQSSLDVASRHFSPEACYGPLIAEVGKARG